MTARTSIFRHVPRLSLNRDEVALALGFSDEMVDEGYLPQPKSRSLQWVLVRRLILLQTATFVAFIALLVAILTIAQPRLIIDNEAAIKHLSEAVARNESGGLIVRDTEELRAFREDFPNL